MSLGMVFISARLKVVISTLPASFVSPVVLEFSFCFELSAVLLPVEAALSQVVKNEAI
jgi:hypothetical protein